MRIIARFLLLLVQGEEDKTILASSKRVHDMLYRSLQVKPPPSWQRQVDRSSSSSIAMIDGDFPVLPGSRGGGYSKQAKLGPTDTASLVEILAVTGPAGPNEVHPVFLLFFSVCFLSVDLAPLTYRGGGWCVRVSKLLNISVLSHVFNRRCALGIGICASLSFESLKGAFFLLLIVTS